STTKGQPGYPPSTQPPFLQARLRRSGAHYRHLNPTVNAFVTVFLRIFQADHNRPMNHARRKFGQARAYAARTICKRFFRR
ncbi:MAG: hypothetical protein SV765_17595, partial [Pseudomonadota bacterium]|nr:hypothetical protein [Pseudomonadota bacterium]